VTWPAVLADDDLKIPSVPSDYRLPLRPTDFDPDQPKSLSTAAIARISDEVELVHAQAMARRRRELLGSLLATLDAAAPKVQRRWTGQWSLELRPPSSGDHYRVEVTPRPARSLDLFHCDRRDPSAPHRRAFLLHPHSPLTPERRELLSWLQQDRDLDCITETTLAPLLRRLQP
jgi:hypothetical protein